MSTNCIRCVVNKRTGGDLLCDECRTLPRDIAFVSSGNEEQDEAESAAIAQRESLLEAGYCPNKCGVKMEVRDYGHECLKCGFEWHTNHGDF
jgi:hypothetical protein